VCELNREVEDTDRRVVHRTVGLKKKRRWLKKVLAWHHHRRGVDDGNQKGGCPLRPAQESLLHYIISQNNHEIEPNMGVVVKH